MMRGAGQTVRRRPARAPRRTVVSRGPVAPGRPAMFTGCNCGTRPVAPPLPPLSAVQITPPLDTLVVGSQRQFTAVALDTNSVAVPGAAIAWSSGDAGVVTVSSTGLVTAVGEGV